MLRREAGRRGVGAHAGSVVGVVGGVERPSGGVGVGEECLAPAGEEARQRRLGVQIAHRQ